MKKHTVTLDDTLPYYGIEQDMLLTKTGSYSLVFRLNFPPVFSMDASRFDTLNSALAKCINSLPSQYSVTRYDLIFPQMSSLTNRASDDISVTEHYNHLHLKERPFVATESFLVITKLPRHAPITTWYNTYFSAGHTKLAINAADKIDLLTQAQRLVDTLERAIAVSCDDQNWKGQPHITQLNADQIVDLALYRILNLVVVEPQRFVAETLNLPDQMETGSKIATVLSMNDDGYPGDVFTHVPQEHGSAQLPVSMLHSLQFHLSFPHIVVNVFYPKGRREAADKLEGKLNRFGSLLRGRSGSYNDVLYSSINEFLRQYREETSQQLVEHHFSVIVIGEKHKIAQHNTNLNEARTLLINSGIQFNESLFTTYAKFHALLPGNVGDIPESERGLVTTEVASCFWSFESAYHEGKVGVRFIDRIHGKPLFLDLWNDKNINNRNFVVFGHPGSGKTFTVLNMIDQWLTLGYQVVAIDKVGNYKLLAEAYGNKATFIECSEHYPLRFNPFIVTKDEYGFWKPTVDEKELIVKTIYTALRLESDDAKNIEERALAILLDEFYKTVRTQKESPTFDQFYNYLEKLPEDERKHLVKGLFNFDEFSVGMKPFLTGESYGEILNGTSNDDILHRPFVVFDNKHVDDNDTLKVLMAYISGLIMVHKLLHRTDKQQPLIILFDEAWANLGSSMGRYLIEYLYRCCRRFLGGVGIITQSIDDVHQSSLSHVISANATTMFSFKPTEKERNLYKSLMSLTDHQLDLLYSLEQKKGSREVFLKTGGFANVYGVETSPFTRLLLSSWADDQALLQGYFAESGNLEQAALSVLEQRGQI